MRIGVSRQKFQRLESQGNPRLDTLELIAKGLNSSLLLIPDEDLDAVQAVLKKRTLEKRQAARSGSPIDDGAEATQTFAGDPWQGLLGDDT